MDYLLLLLSIIFAVVKSSVFNKYAKGVKPGLSGIFKFNTVSYAIAFIILLLCGVRFDVSPFSVIMAFCYAVIVFSLQCCSVAAMSVGSMSLTSLFVLYGMIIPSLAGPIFWSEPFGVSQIVGIVFMLASLWLLSDKEDKLEAKGKWIILVIACFIFSGSAGLAEKVHQMSEYKDELQPFLLTGFLFMFLLSFTGTSVLALKNKEKPFINIKPILVYGAATGVILSVYNRINLMLSGRLNSMVYYPVSNGGALLLTVVVSTLIFKEKLTKRQLTGFLIGLAAIIVLSI